MNFLKKYRLVLLTSIAVCIFFFLFISNLLSCQTVVFDKKNIKISESSGGRWGAFSYDLNIKDVPRDLTYYRTYRRIAISNLFLDRDELGSAEQLFISLSKNEKAKDQKKMYFYVSSKKNTIFLSALSIVSFIFSNQIFYFIWPLILSLFLCNSEYKRSYIYESQFHRRSINFSKYIIGLFFLLIAFY